MSHVELQQPVEKTDNGFQEIEHGDSHKFVLKQDQDNGIAYNGRHSLRKHIAQTKVAFYLQKMP